MTSLLLSFTCVFTLGAHLFSSSSSFPPDSCTPTEASDQTKRLRRGGQSCHFLVSFWFNVPRRSGVSVWGEFAARFQLQETTFPGRSLAEITSTCFLFPDASPLGGCVAVLRCCQLLCFTFPVQMNLFNCCLTHPPHPGLVVPNPVHRMVDLSRHWLLHSVIKGNINHTVLKCAWLMSKKKKKNTFVLFSPLF